jgi:site-specific DNA-methyltransferase (adenine-specific)
MASYQLHLGDCLEILPTLPAASVDAIIADPPYGTTACKWDSVIPLDDMWAELKRVIKPRGAIVLFGSQPFTTELISSNRAWFKYCWVWDKIKPNGMGYAKFQPMRRTEDVIVFCDGVHTYNAQKLSRKRPIQYKNYSHSAVNNVSLGAMKGNKETDFHYPVNLLVFSNANQNNRLHPTQKPVALLEYLIRTYTNEGDTVLDFCFGSGTTGAACIRTGRNFIGIEKDADYYEIAQRRLASEEQEAE